MVLRLIYPINCKFMMPKFDLQSKRGYSMKIRFTRFFLICCAVSTLLFVLTGLVSASEPEAVQQLKDRITDATKNFQDITMLGT